MSFGMGNEKKPRVISTGGEIFSDVHSRCAYRSCKFVSRL